MRKWLNIDPSVKFLGFRKELRWIYDSISLHISCTLLKLKGVWCVSGPRAFFVGLLFVLMDLGWIVLFNMPGVRWGRRGGLGSWLVVEIGLLLEAVEIPLRKHTSYLLWPMHSSYEFVNCIGEKVPGAPQRWAEFHKDYLENLIEEIRQIDAERASELQEMI